MIQILGRPNSVNVQKVMWSAAEIGISVDRHDIGGAFGGNDTADYLSKNPNGRVPTLVDGDFILWESNAIVRYLSEAHGASPWFPDSLEERALCNQWMDWYISTLHPSMTVIFWQLIRTPDKDRDYAGLAAAIEEAGLFWAMLDKHLANHAFVVGDDLTMGDVPLGCAAYRWHSMEIARPDLPNLKRWWQSLAARDAYKQHVMLPLT
ncbi:MAG: glutathione S-transferase family protein [Rhodospirillales bacterium]|nr:glutathione S-transferase family protein [Rhodospirillales bacterium]